MRILFISLLLFFCINSLSGQAIHSSILKSSQDSIKLIINGNIFDDKTNCHMPFAKVWLKNYNDTITTNFDGPFKLEVNILRNSELDETLETTTFCYFKQSINLKDLSVLKANDSILIENVNFRLKYACQDSIPDSLNFINILLK